LDAIPVREILPNVFRQPDEKGGGRIAGYFPVIIPRVIIHRVHSFERRQPRPSDRLIYREEIRVNASIKKRKLESWHAPDTGRGTIIRSILSIARVTISCGRARDANLKL
jgi:hypothetical protein